MCVGWRHVAAGQRDDRARHGGREEHRLARRRASAPGASRRRAGSRGRASRRPRRARRCGRAPRSRWPCLARSISRPGVPTTTSTPLLERLDLRLVGAAAVDGEHADAALPCRPARGRRRPARRARGSGRRRGPAACRRAAASRTRRPRGEVTRLRIGTPKPRVLPVPVLAWPMMSWPARATGRVIAWMGNGVVMPALGERVDDVGVDVEVGERRRRDRRHGLGCGLGGRFGRSRRQGRR